MAHHRTLGIAAARVDDYRFCQFALIVRFDSRDRPVYDFTQFGLREWFALRVAGDDAVFVFWDFAFHICMSLMPKQSPEPMRGGAVSNPRKLLVCIDFSRPWLSFFR